MVVLLIITNKCAEVEAKNSYQSVLPKLRQDAGVYIEAGLFFYSYD